MPADPLILERWSGVFLFRGSAVSLLLRAVFRIQRWWRHCLGYTCSVCRAPWCYEQACSRRTLLDRFILGLESESDSDSPSL
jgi:hypothetical protein